jgi:tetratricopeptide (TPR) repeat protein
MPSANAETLQQAALLSEDAAAYLARGRPDIAEMYAGAALEADARAFEAWLLLARLALARKRPERATAWLRRALELRPADAAAAALLREAEQPPPAASPAQPRYLLIREWSAGFWSDVDHVLGMCLLAEITGRTPVVWWGAQSRFRPQGAGNAWERFFAPVSPARLADCEAPGLRVFPDKWRGRALSAEIPNRWSGDGSRQVGLHFLDRDEDVVVSDFHAGVKVLLPWLPASHALAGKPLPDAYRQLARRYLRPQPAIVAEADRFAVAHFGGRSVVGVHLRGSDKVQEVNGLEALLASYAPLVDARLDGRPDARLFLLTDDSRVRAAYQRRYGTRLVSTSCTRTDSTVGVHFLPHDAPDRIGVEVMVDTLLAARCSEFIGLGYSNVSLFASYLKDWPAGSCRLLGPNAHEAWNALALEMPPPPGAG